MSISSCLGLGLKGLTAERHRGSPGGDGNALLTYLILKAQLASHLNLALQNSYRVVEMRRKVIPQRDAV